MIARARAVAHGSAYTTYATLKRDAEFVCCENMAGDMTAAVTDDDLDNIWMQFKYAGGELYCQRQSREQKSDSNGGVAH